MNAIDLLARGLKDAGKPVIGCFPLYPPLELLHAMGFNPVVLWGLKGYLRATAESDKHVQNFACSVGRHVAELLLSDYGTLFDGIFFYNACDTLRNLPEIIASGMERKKKQFWMTSFHVPMQGIGNPIGATFLKNEISRLVLAIEKHTGLPLSQEKFHASVQSYRKMRELSRALQDHVANGQFSFTEYAKMVQEGYLLPVERAIENIEPRVQTAEKTPPHATEQRVILSGIMPPAPPICKAIEQAGFTITGNDLACMHRSFLYTPANDRDVREYYLDFYTNHCPCPTLLYTGDQRVDYLLDLVKKNKAKAVIFLGEKFCEYEYLEFPFIEKKIKGQGIHVLNLELSVDDHENIATMKNRIDAFAELLRDAVQR